MAPPVQVSRMSFGYAPRGPLLLEDVTFTLEAGDFAAVIGANGAGKSTLLRIILGELAPRSGDARIFGTPAGAVRDWRRAAFVPQSPPEGARSFPATALETVSAALFPRAPRLGFFPAPLRAEALECLRLTGMESRAGRLMGELSGGERQRVLLARALAARPSLLLLDEPTGGVDGDSADDFARLLARLNRERGMTVFMVTHDIARFAEAAGRVFCIEEGNLLEIERAQVEKEMTARHRHGKETA